MPAILQNSTKINLVLAVLFKIDLKMVLLSLQPASVRKD